MKFNGITFLHLLAVSCIGYVISLLVGLPIYHAIGSIIALCLYSLLSAFLSHRQLSTIIDAMAHEYANHLKELTDQFGELLFKSGNQVEKNSVGGQVRTLKPDIVMWNDAKGNTFLHPFQTEITECNKKNIPGERRRYPVLGQTLYITFPEITGNKMSVGRFAAGEDGLLYPVFAEVRPDRLEYIELFGAELAGTVESYYYHSKTKEEFFMLKFHKETDPKKQYILIRLPADRSIKPFKYEGLN